MRRGLFLSFCAFLLPVMGADALTLAPIFRDHAVLQHGRPIPIWGTARPGENIVVDFQGQSVPGVSNAAGFWEVRLEALDVSDQPSTLRVTGHTTLEISDILVGDVWLCSGQSNMAFTVAKAANAEAEIAAARHPLIRHYSTTQNPQPDRQFETEGQWETCSPTTVGSFSAVAYYFAREIQSQIPRPIGIINSSVGGTPIESWMSAEALAMAGALDRSRQRWDEAQIAYEQKTQEFREQGKDLATLPLIVTRLIAPRRQPTTLFNGMIAPVAPTALRGVLWYQGEANNNRPEEYARLFTTLITEWRREFGQPELPFYWVQLANYRGNPSNRNWAELRAAQDEALALPHTGRAVAIDVGETNDIHPRNKQEVGRRLALIALARTYGRDHAFASPTLARARRLGNRVELHFNDAIGGLKPAGEVLSQGFELAGADGIFVPADASISGETIVVSAPVIKQPAAVRYAWANAPIATLHNAANLPLAPFTHQLTPVEIQ